MKFDFVAEQRRMKELKQKEKEKGLEVLKIQQEQNLDKMFALKKEMEKLNNQKEQVLEKKKAV